MRRKHPQVLGVDLNRSESRQAAGPSTTGRYFAGNFTTPKAHGVRELRKKPI